MALLPPANRSTAPPSGGVTVRVAGAADLDAFAGVDAAAFGEGEVGPTVEWTRPHLGSPTFRPLIAELNGAPAGVATGVLADGRHGRSLAILGVGVLPAARRRGIATCLTAEILDWGFASGAELAWLSPNTDAAARLYARLGFSETGGFNVYVEL